MINVFQTQYTHLCLPPSMPSFTRCQQFWCFLHTTKYLLVCVVLQNIYIQAKYVLSQWGRYSCSELKCAEEKHQNRSISQISQCTCSLPDNTPIGTKMCTFSFWMVYCGMPQVHCGMLFWMVNCGIWERCIVGFVRLVYTRRRPFCSKCIVLQICQPSSGTTNMYRKISNIRRTQNQNLNDSRLIMQLPLPNPFKPGVKWRMKM